MLIIAGFAIGLSLSSAKADPNAQQRSDEPSTMLFDIPAQPLAAALERFMADTKLAVVVDSAMIAGRISAAVQGSFSPDVALRSLLAGTGLDARSIGSGAYTVVPLPPMAEGRPPTRFTQYAAAIQQAVTAALCQRDQTRPMYYRIVMRMWLGPTGTVTHVELGSTTGNSSLDAAIGGVLAHVDVGAPPPSGLPQPVKLAIMPHTIGAAACALDHADGQAGSSLSR